MRSVVFLTLVAACSSPSRPAPLGPGEEPSSTDPAPAGTRAPRDPSYDARAAWRNPGGMWLPQQLAQPPHVETLRKLGVTVAPAALGDPLAHPLGAVVRLPFCTGAFVSAEGLIATNHHCAQDALERNATPDANLVETGFLARARSEEKSAGPTFRVLVAQAFRDVTRGMTDGLADIADPTARYAEIERRYKALVAACEEGRPAIKCELASHYHGATYELGEYLELRDVRLVYAPHRAIGNYGGELDNWAWPRHTGDGAFFRAYVGPDGAPADFAPGNVPYRPRHHLRIATQPLAEHDAVIVAGYPGETSRLATYAETRWDLEWTYPFAIERLQAQYDLASELVARGGATGIKAGVYKQGVQNALESTQGLLDGLRRGNALSTKQQQAAALAAWLAAPGREADRAAVERLEAIHAARRLRARADALRSRVVDRPALLAVAHTIVRNAEERPKPDAAREPGFQARDQADLRAAQQAFTGDFDPVFDRAFFRLAIERARTLPEAERPWLAVVLGTRPGQAIDDRAIDRALDRLYRSKLADEKTRLRLLDTATRAQLARDRDPWIRLAVALAPEARAREAADEREAAEVAVLAPKLGAALRDSAGGALAPDANGTLRVTYGTVRRFDGAGPPFTRATEILAKDTGADPFDAPPALLEAVRAGRWGAYADPILGEVPVDFLSDTDTTGGNSGSPTLDARGDLVGLLFDGNLESVASDVVWNHAVTRGIHVDVRYLLWVMTELDAARALATELGVAP